MVKTNMYFNIFAKIRNFFHLKKFYEIRHSENHHISLFVFAKMWAKILHIFAFKCCLIGEGNINKIYTPLFQLLIFHPNYFVIFASKIFITDIK